MLCQALWTSGNKYAVSDMTYPKAFSCLGSPVKDSVQITLCLFPEDTTKLLYQARACSANLHSSAYAANSGLAKVLQQLACKLYLLRPLGSVELFQT